MRLIKRDVSKEGWAQSNPGGTRLWPPAAWSSPPLIPIGWENRPRAHWQPQIDSGNVQGERAWKARSWNHQCLLSLFRRKKRDSPQGVGGTGSWEENGSVGFTFGEYGSSLWSFGALRCDWEQPWRWKSPLKEKGWEKDDATDGICLCCGKKATEPGEALSIVEGGLPTGAKCSVPAGGAGPRGGRERWACELW